MALTTFYCSVELIYTHSINTLIVYVFCIYCIGCAGWLSGLRHTSRVGVMVPASTLCVRTVHVLRLFQEYCTLIAISKSFVLCKWVCESVSGPPLNPESFGKGSRLPATLCRKSGIENG